MSGLVLADPTYALALAMRVSIMFGFFNQTIGGILIILSDVAAAYHGVR
jgi:hypothetical protein